MKSAPAYFALIYRSGLVKTAIYFLLRNMIIYAISPTYFGLFPNTSWHCTRTSDRLITPLRISPYFDVNIQ